MARCDLGERRHAVAACRLDEGATRGEAAAARRLRHVGHAALDRGQSLALAVELGDRAQKPHRVRVLRPREQRLYRRPLDDLAGIHDRDIVGHLGNDAEIVRDQDDRGPGVSAQPAHQVEDLRLDGDVERRGRLIGDQEIGPAGERHGDHHALALAARQLVGIVVDPLLGRGDAHPPQHLDRLRARFGRRRIAVAADRFDDLVADREGGVE